MESSLSFIQSRHSEMIGKHLISSQHSFVKNVEGNENRFEDFLGRLKNINVSPTQAAMHDVLREEAEAPGMITQHAPHIAKSHLTGFWLQQYPAVVGMAANQKDSGGGSGGVDASPVPDSGEGFAVHDVDPDVEQVGDFLNEGAPAMPLLPGVPGGNGAMPGLPGEPVSPGKSGETPAAPKKPGAPIRDDGFSATPRNPNMPPNTSGGNLIGNGASSVAPAINGK